MHSVLPFVLLGIGVDDAFVIANAFDREREGIPRESEDDESLVKRGARSLARAGASITVTSLTDLVAFAISSTSALPALASFCAFASINIFFLWALAATFFTATMVLDEKRQRANKRDCMCCLTRKTSPEAREEDTGAEEGRIPKYFRKYHAPTILSRTGKPVICLIFAALFGFGIYGLIHLPVEDSNRNFIPPDSYIKVRAFCFPVLIVANMKTHTLFLFNLFVKPRRIPKPPTDISRPRGRRCTSRSRMGRAFTKIATNWPRSTDA